MTFILVILSAWSAMLMMLLLVETVDGYYYFDCGFSTRCNGGSCIENSDPATQDLKPYVCNCSGIDGDGYDCTGSRLRNGCHCVTENTSGVFGKKSVGAKHPVYEAGHRDWCRCLETHYGKQCQYPRVFHTCRLSIDIHIEPHMPFEGSIKIIESINSEGRSCPLDVVPSNTLGDHYQKTGHMYAGNRDGCPDPEIIVDDLGMPIRLRVHIRIQNEEQYRPETSQVLTFDCRIRASGEIIDMPTETIPQINGPQNEIITLIENGITVEGENGVRAVSNSNLVNMSSFYLTTHFVTTGSPISDFSVKSIWISNYNMSQTTEADITENHTAYAVVFNWCPRGILSVLTFSKERALRRGTAKVVVSFRLRHLENDPDHLPPENPTNIQYYNVEICMGTCQVVSTCEITDGAYSQTDLTRPAP